MSRQTVRNENSNRTHRVYVYSRQDTPKPMPPSPPTANPMYPYSPGPYAPGAYAAGPYPPFSYPPYIHDAVQYPAYPSLPPLPPPQSHSNRMPMLEADDIQPKNKDPRRRPLVQQRPNQREKAIRFDLDLTGDKEKWHDGDTGNVQDDKEEDDNKNSGDCKKRQGGKSSKDSDEEEEEESSDEGEEDEETEEEEDDDDDDDDDEDDDRVVDISQFPFAQHWKFVLVPSDLSVGVNIPRDQLAKWDEISFKKADEHTIIVWSGEVIHNEAQQSIFRAFQNDEFLFAWAFNCGVKMITIYTIQQKVAAFKARKIGLVMKDKGMKYKSARSALLRECDGFLLSDMCCDQGRSKHFVQSLDFFKGKLSINFAKKDMKNHSRTYSKPVRGERNLYRDWLKAPKKRRMTPKNMRSKKRVKLNTDNGNKSDDEEETEETESDEYSDQDQVKSQRMKPEIKTIDLSGSD